MISWVKKKMQNQLGESKYHVWNVTFIHDVFSHICVKKMCFYTEILTQKVDLCIFLLVKKEQNLFFHLGSWNSVDLNCAVALL